MILIRLSITTQEHPAYIEESSENGIEDPYKWHFSLVISWSAHLDPSDDEIINISPNTIGNVDHE